MIISTTIVNNYADFEVTFGIELSYYLTAMDTHGNESDPSGTVQALTGSLGDINLDTSIDIIDIILICDIILDDIIITDYEQWAADLNADGDFDIRDIIAVVNLILGTGLSRGDEISDVAISYGNSKVELISEGIVSGLQLGVSGDFEITNINLPIGWELYNSESIILIFNLEGKRLNSELVFEFEGKLSIESSIVTDWYGNSLSANLVMIPDEYLLSPAYPNPFNPSTTIIFQLPEESNVYINIYDLQGRSIETLVNKKMDAGYHSLAWRASNMSSGVYLIRMIADDYMKTQKVLLLK